MMKNRIRTIFLIALSTIILLGSCSTKKKYLALEKDYWTKQSALDNCKMAAEEIESELNTLQKKYDRLKLEFEKSPDFPAAKEKTTSEKMKLW